MWTEIANIGGAVMTHSIAIACAVWLATSSRCLALLRLADLAAGNAIVTSTKILHGGFSVEIERIGFRMISGHTMLSTAVWTVTAALLPRSQRSAWVIGIGLGLIVGAAIGAARVVNHSHTISEVVSDWLVGALVATVFLRVASLFDAVTNVCFRTYSNCEKLQHACGSASLKQV